MMNADMAQSVHAVGILYESPEKRLLVLRRNPDVPEGGTWGLVGGKVSDGRTPLETALVKTKAEIGVDADTESLQLVKSFFWDRDDHEITFDVFRAYMPEDTQITLDTEGNVEYRWIEPHELYKWPNLMAGLYPILADVYKL